MSEEEVKKRKKEAGSIAALKKTDQTAYEFLKQYAEEREITPLDALQELAEIKKKEEIVESFNDEEVKDQIKKGDLVKVMIDKTNDYLTEIIGLRDAYGKIYKMYQTLLDMIPIETYNKFLVKVQGGSAQEIPQPPQVQAAQQQPYPPQPSQPLDEALAKMTPAERQTYLLLLQQKGQF